jgi:ABC-2 type transport system permease protein
VVNMPLLFTSTALVPSRQMPEWLAALARWNPLTLAVDGWRGALLFGEAPSWTSQVLPLAVLAVVLYALASWAMRRVGDQY